MSRLMEIVEALEELGKSADFPTAQVKSLLLRYLDECGELLFTSPETIRRVQRAVGGVVIRWAANQSPCYRDLIPVDELGREDTLDRVAGRFLVGKTDLMNRDEWFTDIEEGSDTQTSGSTGAPFRYRIWDPSFVGIEKNRHYRLILEEFGLVDRPRVLHMVSGLIPAGGFDTFPYGRASIKMASYQIQNYVQRLHCSHGGDDATFFHVQFNEQAYLHMKDFCRFLVQFIEEEEITVLLASGGLFELLTTYLISDESHDFPHLVKLISNTGDRVNLDTLEFLVEAGVADHYCDHMRTWDGGITFFTCKEGTYHLSEELAFTFSDSDERLASVDFFNLASPFVNYLNGDYGVVGEEWEQCGCGRWHRPFKFLNRRSRSSRTQSGGYYDTEALHNRLKEKYNIQFVSFQDSLVTIEDSALTPEQKEEIILDLANDHLATYFFTQKDLRAMNTYDKGQFSTSEPDPPPEP